MQCPKGQTLVPEDGSTTLVLLNCGHIEHLSCWEFQKQEGSIVCPYNASHGFPFIIASVNARGDQNKRLKVWRANQIQQFRKWTENQLNPVDTQAYNRQINRLKNLQQVYTLNQVLRNYVLFFTQPNWNILLSRLELAKVDFVPVIKWAIHNNQPAIVDQVAPFVKLDSAFDGTLSYLLLASLYGYTEVVERLINWFPNPLERPAAYNNHINQTTGENLNALHFASRSLYYDLANLLVSKGIDKEVLDGFTGRTPLAYAIERASLRLVALYLSEGARPDVSLVLQTGPMKMERFTYLDLVTKYLVNKHLNYDQFYKAFDYVLKGDFHLLDRLSGEQLIPIEIILGEGDYCTESFLTSKQLNMIIGNHEIEPQSEDDKASVYVQGGVEENKETLCEKVGRLIESGKINKAEIFRALSGLFCLYCNLPFNNLEEMFTTEAMSKCGLVHHDCSVNHFVICSICKRLIVNVREPSLIALEKTFYHEDVDDQTSVNIANFLQNSHI